ncbi:MAG: hypothetical protein LBL25_01715 [Oscillospiraceae bacterium]|jgi:hypothetical protein|nr:hypothetical protein [Oscillospiraceae bacterium]
MSGRSSKNERTFSANIPAFAVCLLRILLGRRLVAVEVSRVVYVGVVRIYRFFVNLALDFRLYLHILYIRPNLADIQNCKRAADYHGKIRRRGKRDVGKIRARLHAVDHRLREFYNGYCPQRLQNHRH